MPDNPYKSAVLQGLSTLLERHCPPGLALDFGSGDGWYARRLLDAGIVRRLIAVEVQRRPRCAVPPLLYDGERLPFRDRTFDLSMAIDVLHHCPSPEAAIADLARSTRRHIVVKDHTHRSRLGWWALALLDELGNRRFGIPCRYHYQRGWAWDDLLTRQGFTLVERRYPFECEPRAPLRWLVNRFHFLSLWERL